MGSITVRVRSVVWFVTGALLATVVTLMFVHAWRVDAAPGDDDATFVAITPCRLADTRPAPDRVGPATTLGPAGTQTFVVHGSNGECTIPTEAVAVSLNVTAVGASQRSFLTLWPDGEQPLASSLNPAPGEPPTPNAVTVDLSAAGGFNVFNNNGFVDVVIDVNGYHTKTSLKDLADRLTAVEATAATNAAGIAGLDGQRPFAVTTEETPSIPTELTATPTAFAAVTVNAPVAGHVTIGSTASVFHNLSGGAVACVIFETPLPVSIPLATPSFQQFLANSNGELASLSGTRTFEIDAGANVTYALGCIELGPGGFIRNRNLTAVFTPEP